MGHLLASLDEVLGQGECLLLGLSDAQYADAAPANVSIGAHYRHSLEHFKILFESMNEAEIDYDRRERDERLENERLAALQVTRDFRHAARFLATLPLEREIQARCKISYTSAGSCATASTIGREILYVVSHAIHHYAMIALICGMRKVPVPDDFGVAPSTLEYQKQSESERRSA
jgi:hypothetical protein